MITEITDENYEALSQYRRQRARETLAEIPYLRDQGFYNTATNRLYYACYYAALALLTKNHISLYKYSENFFSHIPFFRKIFYFYFFCWNLLAR